MPRKPWEAAELEELALVRPGDKGAITRHAAKHDRKPSAVSSRLLRLRQHQQATDVPHLTPVRFHRQVRLTHRPDVL